MQVRVEMLSILLFQTFGVYTVGNRASNFTQPHKLSLALINSLACMSRVQVHNHSLNLWTTSTLKKIQFVNISLQK